MRKHKIIHIPSFFVDRENRVVVCTLRCDLDLYNHPAGAFIYPDFYKDIFPDMSFGKFSVRAKARCSQEDDFDESAGKALAYRRAKTKMYRKAAKVFKLCHEKFLRFSRECALSYLGYANIYSKETDAINKKCHGE